MSTGRLYNSTPDPDAAELAWWRKFADSEEKFCWVQTPTIQRVLRGRYVREMISTVPGAARIAELGCGAGWLAILLAQLGASEVVGIDFSPEQFEKARSRSFAMRLGNRVRFEAGSVSDIGRQF